MAAYYGAPKNAQGLWMAKTAAQARKRIKAYRLLVNGDFLMQSEAHSTDGGAQAAVNLPGNRSWWASGTAARAGVGIIVKEACLWQVDLEARVGSPWSQAGWQSCS